MVSRGEGEEKLQQKSSTGQREEDLTTPFGDRASVRMVDSDPNGGFR